VKGRREDLRGKKSLKCHLQDPAAVAHYCIC
jgi:hypothetical protein